MEPWQDQMLQEHDRDLYKGNGKPGLTTRMAIAEEAIQRIASNWRAIILMFLATLLSAVANLVLHFLGK